jgi:hypothetical protein
MTKIKYTNRLAADICRCIDHSCKQNQKCLRYTDWPMDHPRVGVTGSMREINDHGQRTDICSYFIEDEE